MDPWHISVIGAGLMGHGIALTLARAGHTVVVTDPMAEARDALEDRIAASMTLMGAEADIKATLSRVSTADSIADAVKGANAVFEAAPEKMALKRSIFAEVEASARGRGCGAQGRDPGFQYLGHADHRDHGRAKAPQSGARDALVEPPAHDPAG